MRSDSPPARWYEPADPIEDVELVDMPHDELVIGAGGCSWYATLATDDDTDD